MRILLAELAPVLGEPDRNLDRIDAALRAGPADLAVFPELFLTGYRVGDRFHALALAPGDPAYERLGSLARERGCAIVVGAPTRSAERPGEIHNAALLVRPDGTTHLQAKRFLPTFGPFEEGVHFTEVDRSRPAALGDRLVGLEICYDAFFPEVSRELALGGAALLVAISAAPVTSRRLFDRVLPARAIENALPVVYVNRVGVEDGFVFGGGSVALDARGEVIDGRPVELPGMAPEERLLSVDVDLSAPSRWRPFRPVLRDVSTRPGALPEGGPATG
ncbi:MAG TPA: nitrilase-related carbon-nitrogen hydrolase [Thermoplasmata archaeon]|nr:nitrilase-related carbon-nitrogen hydrolase [Thermoplasmata archaeon]